MKMDTPFRQSINYRVPYADTDQMQVVYYANYLVYFERVRNELLRASGLSYRELEEHGLALPVAEAHVHYHAPARYDDQLEITGWCEAAKGVRLKICCEVKRDGKVLVDGYTIHAFVNMKTLRPTRPSPEFLKALGLVSPSPNA